MNYGGTCTVRFVDGHECYLVDNLPVTFLFVFLPSPHPVIVTQAPSEAEAECAALAKAGKVNRMEGVSEHI